MTAPRDSLATILSAVELARVDELVVNASPNASFGLWLSERGMVVVGAKLDGELVGWLLVPVADEFEARALAETLSEGLAQLYGPMRAAREAAAEALKKAAH